MNVDLEFYVFKLFSSLVQPTCILCFNIVLNLFLFTMDFELDSEFKESKMGPSSQCSLKAIFCSPKSKTVCIIGFKRSLFSFTSFMRCESIQFVTMFLGIK